MLYFLKRKSYIWLVSALKINSMYLDDKSESISPTFLVVFQINYRLQDTIKQKLKSYTSQIFKSSSQQAVH